MATDSDPDTIRILVATDNHVGYEERDPIRGDDSWRSFDEVMKLAKNRDVDMVLLAGDLFHENQPSRKAMFQVMRSLRENCYGDKPCELELLSDPTEGFTGAFNHVNYEDPDINVAIPVFSIHGNHDDPSGEGHFAALDLLQTAGLLNYYGRTPEADNIHIRPVLLQKGSTKLALYGMSNVRDERLFRTFRDGKVHFYQPNTQKSEWYNIMSVHQNHHAYTDTGYLPENFLPSFMDMIIWGHEHECKIDPQPVPSLGFRVMQPGSSVATSLVQGESVEKHVSIMTIKGKTCTTEKIRLKSVRPFVYKEIVLQDYKPMVDLAYEQDNTAKLNAFLMKRVDELIKEANDAWIEAQGDDRDPEEEPPLPLVRLRVEHTAPAGGEFHIDNAQRFSRKFQGRVANTTDVVQFHKKRAKPAPRIQGVPDMPESEALAAQAEMETIKVGDLVQEFLAAQTLAVLPQMPFSDAVGQYVNKDDKHAMEMFVKDSIESQVKQLIEKGKDPDEFDEDAVAEQMEEIKHQMEEAFAKGELKRSKHRGTRKPKPDYWDSDQEGQHWEESIHAMIFDDEDGDAEMVDEDSTPAPTAARGAARGRGSRGGRAGKTTAGATRKATAAAAKKAPAKTAAAKGRKKIQESDEEDDDVIMIDSDHDDGEEESQGLFVSQASTRAAPARKAPARKAAPVPKQPLPTQRQSTISFGSTQTRTQPNGRARPAEPSDDEISDDGAFEPAPMSSRRGGRR